MVDDMSEGRNTSSATSETNLQITPELVQAVTDRVWQLWKRDLQIERERYRPIHQPFLRQGGPY